MATETYSPSRPSTQGQRFQGPSLDLLSDAIERSSGLLPEAGPLSTFIYQNSLQAFEDMPFHDALKRGEQVYGCQPYLTEDEYREALARGRIRFPGLKGVLIKDLGDRAWEEIPCSAPAWSCVWRCSSTRCGPGRPRSWSGTLRKRAHCGASGRTPPRPSARS